MIYFTTVLVFAVLPLITCVPVAEHLQNGNVSTVSQKANSSATEITVFNETAVLVLSTVEYSHFTCPSEGDGVFRDRRSCTLHYRCSGGRREVYKCIEGYSFNDKTSRCEESGNVTCAVELNALVKQRIQPCRKQENGFYANYSTACQHYYRCEGESLTSTHSCEKGSSFSFPDQACMPTSHVSCVEAHCADNGYFILPGTTCRAYYKCDGGLRKEALCPLGQTFNVDTESCTASRSTCYEPLCTGRTNGRYPDTTHNCHRSFSCVGGKLTSMFSCPRGQHHDGKTCTASTAVSCPSVETTAVAIQFPDSCTSLEDGTHRSTDSECRRFFVCRAGKTVATLQCPEGLRFDGQHCTPAESTPCSLDCTSQTNGYHVDAASSCREYLYCTDGRTVARKKCPEGSLYNGQTCVPSALYTCPHSSQIVSECSTLENGLHTDYSSGCRNYFYCSSGNVLFRSSCPDSFVWDGDNCVKQTQFVCIGPEPWTGCSAMKTGLYSDQSVNSKCRKYYYCSNGQRTRMSCADNEIFNGKKCVPSDSYMCPSEDTDSCDNKQDGYYQDSGSSCRSYFYCSNGYKITYICFGTFVFNGKECVDPSSYKCPFISQDCAALTNGYHHDKSSGCRKYFYCMEGDKITTLTCAGGKLFDGRRCVQKNLFQCPVAVNVCAAKPDGLFPDTNSGCRRYYKCIGQKQESAFICRDGKVFDGTECVVYTSTQVCSSTGVAQNLIASSSDCGNSLNGFYQDETSGCRQYYFCIDGKKTVLTCPSNQLFDGQVCVDSNSYSCPTLSVMQCKNSTSSNKTECSN